MKKDPFKELLRHEESQQKRFEKARAKMAEEIEAERADSVKRIDIAEAEVEKGIRKAAEDAKQRARDDILKVKKEFDDKSRLLDRNLKDNLDIAVEKVFSKVIKDVQS